MQLFRTILLLLLLSVSLRLSSSSSSFSVSSSSFLRSHRRQLQYTAGNQSFGSASNSFVLLRLGTGSGALSTSATVPVFLDEYTFTRTGSTVTTSLVRSIPLNTTNVNGGNALTLPATTSQTDTHGQINLSENEYYLLVGGYDAPTGTTSYASRKRIIQRIDSDSNIETMATWSSTGTSNYYINNVASDNGERFWVATQDSGCFYIGRGQTSATLILTARFRTAAVKNGRLYCTRGNNAAIQQFPIALPNTTQASSSNFNSVTFSDGRGMEWHPNQLEYYTADQGIGLFRVTRPNTASTTWTKSSTYQAGLGSNINTMLDTALMNDNITLMVVTSGSVYAFRIDALGWANSGNSVLSAPANTQFRGISRVPIPLPSPSATPTASNTPSVTPSVSQTSSNSPTASQTPSSSPSPSASVTPTISNTPSVTPTISTTNSPIDYVGIAARAAAEASNSQTMAIIGVVVGLMVVGVGGGFAAKVIHSRRTAARIRKLKQSASLARGTYMHGLDDLPDTMGKEAPMTVVYQVSMGPRSNGPTGNSNGLTAKGNFGGNNRGTNMKDNLGAYKDPGSKISKR